MKTPHYAPPALNTLRADPTTGAKLREKLGHLAAATASTRAKATTPLTHSPASRLRIGEAYAIFEEGEADLVVTKIGRRGDHFE